MFIRPRKMVNLPHLEKIFGSCFFFSPEQKFCHVQVEEDVRELSRNYKEYNFTNIPGEISQRRIF